MGKSKNKPAPLAAGEGQRRGEGDLVAKTIECSDLRPNPWNIKRPIDAEFLQSIKDQGVLQPILVRLCKDWSGYEIVAGERRWLASKESGWENIPACIWDLDDQRARELTFIENNARAGLTPWQEAELLRGMADLPGFDIKKASAALGWDETRIRRRMKFLDLTPAWQKVMAKPPQDFERWTAAHFQMVAKYPPAFQTFLLKAFEQDTDPSDCDSLGDLANAISQYTHDLRTVPWDIKDTSLVPKAGSCVDCPKRTGAQADLFGETEGKAKPSDRCLDLECYDKKKTAHLERRKAELQADGGRVALISGNYGSSKGVIGRGDYEKVKKGTPGAIVAIVVEGDGAGTETFIKLDRDASATAQRAVKAPTEQAGPASTLTERKRLKWVQRYRQINLWIRNELKKPYPKHIESKLVRLTVAFGTGQNAKVNNYGPNSNPWLNFEKLEASSGPELLLAFWKQVAEVIDSRLLTASGSGHDHPEAEGKKAAQLLGMDWKGLCDRSVNELPDPASWAKEEAEKASQKTKAPKKGKKK